MNKEKENNNIDNISKDTVCLKCNIPLKCVEDTSDYHLFKCEKCDYTIEKNDGCSF